MGRYGTHRKDIILEPADEPAEAPAAEPEQVPEYEREPVPA